MWTKVENCGKQLTVFTKVRESEGDYYNLYEITEVEFDQYKLELKSRNDKPATEKLQQVLSCKQMVEYGFEIEQPASAMQS